MLWALAVLLAFLAAVVVLLIVAVALLIVAFLLLGEWVVELESRLGGEAEPAQCPDPPRDVRTPHGRRPAG